MHQAPRMAVPLGLLRVRLGQPIMCLSTQYVGLNEVVFDSTSEGVRGRDFLLIVFEPLKCNVLQKNYNVGQLNGIMPSVVGACPFVLFQPIAYVRVRAACEDWWIPLVYLRSC